MLESGLVGLVGVAVGVGVAVLLGSPSVVWGCRRWRCSWRRWLLRLASLWCWGCRRVALELVSRSCWCWSGGSRLASPSVVLALVLVVSRVGVGVAVLLSESPLVTIVAVGVALLWLSESPLGTIVAVAVGVAVAVLLVSPLGRS